MKKNFKGQLSQRALNLWAEIVFAIFRMVWNADSTRAAWDSWFFCYFSLMTNLT